MKETILTFCAHNDDQIIGVGGTLAKYAEQGKKIITVIFSYGETSHPHIKKEITIKTRVEESKKADKILGLKDTIYLGLGEGKFLKEIEQKKLKNKLKNIIKINKPTKIFTHSSDDPHPDHRAVNKIAKQIYDELKLDCGLYTFDVWNPIKIKKRGTPKLIVDITETFNQKVNAFKAHKSQSLTIITLLWSVYLKAILNGIENGVKFAEVFNKVK